MSRQNKVNPGMYTQRGRLSQDDIARELARQRSAIEPPHGWKAEQHHPFQPPEFKDDNAEGGEQADEPVAESAKPAKKRPVTAKPAAKPKTAARTVKAKRAGAARSAKTAKVKAKSARTAKSAKTAKPKARAKAKK